MGFVGQSAVVGELVEDSRMGAVEELVVGGVAAELAEDSKGPDFVGLKF